MAVAIYGGSFNPPHLGHVHAAKAVMKHLRPEKLIIIPAGIPPHKEMAEQSADNAQRMEMCRLAFGDVSGVTVSDMEMCREGKSYTSDTIRQVQEKYPGEKLILVMGTDMFLTLDTWHEAEFILKNVHVAVVRRDEDKLAIRKKALEYAEKFRTPTAIIALEPVVTSSSALREALPNRRGREMLSEKVYGYIVGERLYGVRPDWEWLRREAYAMLKPKRVAHVRGCEEEAVRLARRWGADEEKAAEAAILHDITKRLNLREQLILCEKYGIIPDALEAQSEKLLHAKTGAAIAGERFGVCDEVYEAIKWHTTGKAGMSLMDKIIYMADYIEPNRDFEGLEELRALAYEDLDAAMVLGFKMSLEDLARYNVPPHPNTMEALESYGREE